MPPSRDAVTLPAPAKINLSLHVCGKRADGYHLLDSLVCFTAMGDVVTARPADSFSLDISGPFAAGLEADDNNLVLRAARFIAARHRRTDGVRFSLEKYLPVASGIGGGSSDAAASLLACATLWNVSARDIPTAALASALGADLPVCLARTPTRMTGIGETLAPVPALPPVWLVLINPGLPLATKTVFTALNGRHSGPAPVPPRHFADAGALANYLSTCTNDLMAPAVEALPQIKDVLDALDDREDCLLARLSGSGPTCFGLFGDAAAAAAAAKAIVARNAGWWIAPTPLFTAP